MAEGDQAVRPVVIVPVHQPSPTAAEQVSLRQLGKTIRTTPIILVSPSTISTDYYQTLLPGSSDLKVPPEMMSSVGAYNQMMISPLIYNSLQGYSHMLVHEPDALVFRDELAYWCRQPYDYIGAAWVSIGPEGQISLHPSRINGGFSLCRLTAMRRVTSSWKRWHGLRIKSDLLAGLMGDLRRLKRAGLVIYPGGLLRGAYQLYPGNWDTFFTKDVPPLIPEFQLAPPEQRVRFSWEVGCKACMDLNDGQLPFGLHAWAKYDYSFLRPHLLNAGIDLTPMEAALST